MLRHHLYSDRVVGTGVVLPAQRTRLFILPFVAVLLILTVGSVGQAAGQATSITLNVSAPANGTHFVVGEAPMISVSLPEQYSREDYSQLRLHVYGPQETTKTVTAVKLLNASTDRSTGLHHYINLITDPNVGVNGNVLTYNLQAVSDEAPGTYTASLWVVMKDSSIQSFPLADFQIGTATAETQIVDKDKCAQCHLGASNGQFYFHHVDPRQVGSFGYPSIDSWPVRTCKSCHNTDGYAAYRGDITKPEGDRLQSTLRTPDPIVRRVHGVHMGEGLENAFNTDPNTGDFKTPEDYTGVVFPADVRNCTYCHVDDRWKTAPSRLACGACHDNIWFGSPATMPPTAEAHPGGSQATDAGCSFCHPADKGGVKAVAEAHKVEWVFKNTVELAMSAPANGTYYVAGEAPQVTITIKDAVTGVAIDPATIVEPADAKNVQPNEWRRANLFVSGPRVDTEPVLTTQAAKRNPNEFYAENDLRVHNGPTKDDPRITRTATSIVYQLDDVAGLKPGSYTAFVEVTPSSILGGWQVMNFQVGTQTEEPKVCTNCTNCHGDNRQHREFFAVKYDTDICKNCHDYERQTPGVVGWKFPGGWNGYGAQPIVRKVHGVHFGHYLHSPEDVVFPALRKPDNPNGFDFSKTIFPQDIRNCTKCHADNPAWIQEPSRLACLACHDSDEARFHGTLMTFDLTPDDPYSGDEVETCIICHGEHAAFSPDQMHNISDPYKPPYPREPAGK